MGTKVKSRAAVFSGPGRPVALTTLDAGLTAPGQTLVRIEACTLCGSDLHSYFGRRSTPLPTILGHEILGVIEEAAGLVCAVDGTPLNPGDRVTWAVAVSCGQCFYCTHGLPQKCESLRKYGHQSLDSDMPLSGGLADRCLLAPRTAIVRVPADMDVKLACPASCATATVAAMLRASSFKPGESILIQGLGMLGLTACAMAREYVASRIIGIDPDPRRCDQAIRFGADVGLRPDDPSLRDIVLGLTDRRGADVILELSGDRAAITAGLTHLRIGGRYILAGAIIPGDAVPIDPRDVILRMLSLQGIHNYAPTDLLAGMEFLTRAGTKYPFTELVSDAWPLAEVDQAFRLPADQRPPRVLIIP